MMRRNFRFNDTRYQTISKHAVAWVALCLALGVHVTDEALTDFLSLGMHT
jgi:hypothetical protein